MKLRDFPDTLPATPVSEGGSMTMADLRNLARTFQRKAPQRHAVLLQGPAGPFFRYLSKALRKSGIDATHICFHRADAMYSNACGRVFFDGDLAEWAAWFTEFLALRRPDCIILYGSERPAHRTARAIAERSGTRVICLEEGYIRPGFVTVEDGGNNASSPLAGRLPNVPATYAGLSPLVVPSAERRMLTHRAAYYLLRCLLPRGRSAEMDHRPVTPIREFIIWLRAKARLVAARPKCRRLFAQLCKGTKGRFFVVVLQVSTNSNPKEAALGWTTDSFSSAALTSFACSAPEDVRLVFKIHPLEPCRSEIAHSIRTSAQSLGMSARVDILHQGPISPLVRLAAGLLTINSTSGLSALHHGTPLLAVGLAVYSHPRLATCPLSSSDFDEFWTRPPKPDRALGRAFLDWLRQNSLVSGDFYTPAGMTSAAEAITQKLRVSDFVPSRPIPDNLGNSDDHRSF